jgi:ADP-ribose pyrophosphatase YjhB (NUDIX family)
VYTKEYKKPKTWTRRSYSKKKKAGVCLLNKGKLLIVQSHGNKWGMPKGGIEPEDDNDRQKCALRELQEETGITLDIDDIQSFGYRKHSTKYFYTNKNMTKDIPDDFDLNTLDSSGIGWIKLGCIKEMDEQDMLSINSALLSYVSKKLTESSINDVFKCLTI